MLQQWESAAIWGHNKQSVHPVRAMFTHSIGFKGSETAKLYCCSTCDKKSSAWDVWNG